MTEYLMTMVRQLQRDERELANRLHGPIRTMEEGFGVLAEQIQELTDEAVRFRTGDAYGMDTMLRCARIMPKEHYRVKLAEARERALLTACEAIQVAAVCDRYTACIDRMIAAQQRETEHEEE